MIKIEKIDDNVKNAFEEIFLTPKDVKCSYKIPVSTQAKMRKNGLPYYQIGRMIRYSKKDLTLWFENQKLNKTPLSEE